MTPLQRILRWSALTTYFIFVGIIAVLGGALFMRGFGAPLAVATIVGGVVAFGLGLLGCQFECVLVNLAVDIECRTDRSVEPEMPPRSDC